MNGDAARRVPLDLRSQLAAVGFAQTDRLIVDGLPAGAMLTAGQCKAGHSWTILPHEIENIEFVAAKADGETHTLDVFVLTPDPMDPDLAKTKCQFNITVTTPLAAEPESAPAETPKATGGTPVELPDNVIHLPGDGSPAPALTELPPEIEANDDIRMAVEQYIAAAQVEWQQDTARQIAAAEARLTTKHQDQLSVIESLLSTEEQSRTAAIEAKWQAEVERQVAAAESRLTARHKEQMASLEARWRAKQAVRPGRDGSPSIDIDALLDDERHRWRNEQASTLAAARADWEAAAERRLSDARAEWQIGEARRTAALREAWQAEQATSGSADEAQWRAELERQLAAAEARINAKRDEELRAAEARWRSEAAARQTPQINQAPNAEAIAEIEAKLSAEFAERIAAAETALRAEYDERLSAAEAKLRIEYADRMAAAEAMLSQQYQERLGAIEATWKAKADAQAAGAAELHGKIAEAIATARATWQTEEAERLAAAQAAWASTAAIDAQISTQQQIAEMESQLAALYDMRMAAAELAWRRNDGERLAQAEVAWRKAEAERMAAAEARWRTEHERRMEVVLQNAVNMIKGQFGAITGQPLPAVNPAPARAETKDERVPAPAPTEAADKDNVTVLRAVVAA